ncbi:MAG TPA: alpha/beta fold hydrolase [Micromonosporaceae bacterium]|nr:alpha/beta fold hydrolase [Micromonosporaceae bacterium]
MVTAWGRRWPVVAAAVVAVLLAAAGAVGLSRADNGLVRRIVVVDGVPLHEVRPVDASGPMPGVVVVHGYASSARLMYPFADTLARSGYVVVLPDLTGHAANLRRMSTLDLLQQDLDVALRHLRSLPSVAADRVALLGHSMGAAAVTRYATEHDGVPATVAISLRDAGSLPSGAGRPRNLLLLYGAAEFSQFPEAAGQALRLGYPDGHLARTYGDPASGTARRAVAVPGAEHISVLYMTPTHAEAIGWLDAVLRPGQPLSHPIEPRRRLVPAALLLLAFLLGGYPLAVVLFGRHPRDVASLPDVRPAAFAGGLAAALGLAVALAEVAPTARLPLAVGGYLAGFFAITGAGLLVAWRLARRPAAGSPATPQGDRARMVTATTLFTGYAVAAVAVPLHLGLAHATPAGQRWWLLAVVAAANVALLWTAELVSAGRGWRHATVLAAAVAALLVATVIGLAPGFLLLVLSLLAILLAWQAAWAAVLRRQGAPPWAGAVAGGFLVAWPIATSLPLV